MLKKLISLKNLIWFCAIGLAVFSGYYSIYGISKLFSGGSWSIIGMAGMLELSKLVVVTFLHDNLNQLRPLFKFYLVSAAIVLMILTSVGVYGYLTNSYQETAKSIYETQNKINILDKKKNIFIEQKSQIDTIVKQKSQRITSYDQLRLTQENSLNVQLTMRKGTKGLQRNIQSVDNSTQSLNTEISELNQRSIGLSDSLATLNQTRLELENSTFTSEIGPLIYLSRLTGSPIDVIVNWFIIILVSVFDPLAVSLVIAGNHLSYKDRLLKNTVNSQITDDVTTKINTESIVETPVEETINLGLEQLTDEILVEQLDTEKPIEHKEKNTRKEIEINNKKKLENRRKSVILDHIESTEEQKVYGSSPENMKYRRGRSV